MRDARHEMGEFDNFVPLEGLLGPRVGCLVGAAAIESTASCSCAHLGHGLQLELTETHNAIDITHTA